MLGAVVMTRRAAALATVSMALWCAMLGAFMADASHAMPMHGRPVALAQASIEPDWMRYVPSDGHAHPRTDDEGRPNVCGKHEGQALGYFVEASAYRWDGSALGGQRWRDHRTVTYWRDTREGGAVTYDGYTFRNHTARPVLVAGWCE